MVLVGRGNASVLSRAEMGSKDNQQTLARDRQTNETTRARGSIVVEKSAVGEKDSESKDAKARKSERAKHNIKGMSKKTLQ